VRSRCSISSQVLEFIERTRAKKKGSADHLGNPPSSGAFRGDALQPFWPSGLLARNEGSTHHVGVCVILGSAACMMSKFVSYLPHHRVRSGHGRNDFGSLREH